MKINAKQRYYYLLSLYKLDDIFKEIPELSYSEKLNILNLLLITHKFKSSEIKKAFILYKKNYIDINKVDLRLIKNILIGLCTLAQEGY